VEKHVSRYPEFSLAIGDVELDARCLWLPEEARKQIESSVLSLKSLNLLSADVLWDIEDRLSSTPWVREVSRVEKIFPRSISFSLVLRRPVAWISHGTAVYLADVDATRLPVSDRNTPEIAHLPVIEGVSDRTAPPAPGQQWRSRQVREGVYVAARLQAAKELPEALVRIRTIDVREAGGRGKGVVLVTDKEERLEWGKPPLPGNVSLISEEEKLANLRLVLQGEFSVEEGSCYPGNSSYDQGKPLYYLLWTTPLTVGPRKTTTDNPK
jgi:hypothetical protein